MTQYLNKSLGTNVISFIIFIIPIIFPNIPGALAIRDMGLFAFSGGLTNWIAIHMLFEKVPFLYGSGIITARFESFKVAIHGLIMNNFFSEQNFAKFIESHDPGGLADSLENFMENIEVGPLYDGLISVVESSKIGPMLSVLGGKAALETLREPFTAEVKKRLTAKFKEPGFIADIFGQSNGYGTLRDKVEQMVSRRLDELTPPMVKDIIQKMIKEHLGWLVVWGGVFGGLIGLLSSIFFQLQK